MISYAEQLKQEKELTKILKEQLSDVLQSLSANNEFFSGQLISLGETLMDRNTDVIRLEQKIKYKRYN